MDFNVWKDGEICRGDREKKITIVTEISSRWNLFIIDCWISSTIWNIHCKHAISLKGFVCGRWKLGWTLGTLQLFQSSAKSVLQLTAKEEGHCSSSPHRWGLLVKVPVGKRKRNVDKTLFGRCSTSQLAYFTSSQTDFSLFLPGFPGFIIMGSDGNPRTSNI